jgi:acyl transferase domain-containing protein/thioesterase domain-containing protein
MTGHEIAVIGMAGHFPGARSTDEFWNNLKHGVESVRLLSEEELIEHGVLPSDLADPAYVRSAAILDGVDLFDAGFFGFSPRDAAILDPQHRHFLECAWEALEHAGHVPEQFPGAIGVYAGSGMNSYLIYNLLTNQKLLKSAGLFLLRQTGNDKDVLATRVSYQLNLRGPSINIQTACSTSLVSIHMACQSLLNNECDMALAGGVTVEIPHAVGYTYREGEILSQDGHCRSFDASSTGTVFGSGLGIVALRRLRDAIEDGDHIHAVILGSAINNDGSRKVGYLAPSVEGQAEVITEALAVADVDARSISYVETHGTGTRVGDPIEISALTQAYRNFTRATNFCAIGSVKSNIGHLDTAAGVAGFIKTVLALKHGQIPASLHFEKPNPHIDFAKSPFYVNTRLLDWKSEGRPRRAAVTSLGIGGTNAHVVLEEPPRLERPKEHRDWQVLTLSARSEAALDRAAEQLAGYLQENPGVDIADVSFTCQLGRKAFSHRRALACRNLPEAIEALHAKSRPAPALSVGPEKPEVVFLFSGQGSQYVNMGRELYRDEPVFREQIDLCANLLHPHFGLELRTVLYPSGELEQDTDQLNQTWVTQPALFAVEYALAKLWASWGVVPQAMVGHSIGEYVAACLAGVFSLEAALAIVATRARLMQSLPAGAMIAVLVAEQDLLPLLPADISIAAINGPQQCVASGTHSAIEELARELDQREIPFRRLHTSHAFHSQMTEPILAPFAEFVNQFAVSPPAIPYLSNVTGTWITPADVKDPDYWKRHLRGTVRFTDALEELFRKPGRILLEIGPGQTLSSLARQHPGKAANQPILQSMRHPNEPSPDGQVLLTALGQLWVSGARIDWSALRAHDRGYRIPLPTYPFEHQRYWIEPGVQTATASSESTEAPQGPAQWFYRQAWKLLPHEKYDVELNQKWLVLGSGPLSRAITNRLRHLGHDVTVVTAGDKFSPGGAKYTIRTNAPEDYKRLIAGLVAKGKLPSRIVHLWALDPAAGADPLEAGQAGSFYSLLYLAQALGEQDVTGIELAAISDRMQSVAGEAALHAESATLLGPCRVIPKEYSGLASSSIDISLAEPDYDSLAQQIIDEVAPGTSSIPVRALRGVDRWAEFFQPVTLGPASSNSRLRERGVYLITGGLGGVGLKLACRLAKEVHARLVLTGRAPFPPREEWPQLLRNVDAEPLSRQIRAILEMEKAGAEVHVVRANVTEPLDMRTAIAEAQKRFGVLHGVIHAAGVLDDGPIQFKTKEQAHAVLAPKLKGTLVLDEVLKNADVDFLALFSSISSVSAPAGQVDYAAANAFLDAFARSRPAHGNRLTIAINWPLWRDVGMGATGPKSQPLAHRHPLLHTRIADRSQAKVFSASLSCATHWILKDHRFREGKSLLPGTGYLEMAVAGLGSAEDGPVELRDVFFVAPFACDPDETRELRITVKDKDGAASRFSISSKIGETAEWQEYAVGTGGQPERTRPDPVSVQEIIARCNVGEISFQDRLTKQEEYFFFGPRWRSLQRIHVGKDEGVSVVELPAEFHSDLQEYRIHPALLDIATGSALYLLQGYESANHLYLPIGYKKITVWDRLPGKVYSHIHVTGENTDNREVSTFDIVIFDQAGVPLIEIEGFAMRRVAGQQLEAVRDGTFTSTPLLNSRPGTHPKAPEGISATQGENAFLQILSSPDIGGRIVFSPADPNVIAKAPERNTRAASDSPPEVLSGSPPRTAGDSKDEIEQALAGWWQELLGTSCLGVNDDFFDLGGHSLVAVRLFVKIKKAYRVDLDLRVLFEARTIGKLAGAIRAEIDQRNGPTTAAPRRWSSLVPIHPSGDLPPIYFVSGAGGHVLVFESLTTYLGPAQPVYALQPPGLDGKQSFLTRLEDIAAHYLKEIKAVQPHGPYYLAGYSFGGIVTFEMAQQLVANGDKVGMLVLLDTTWRYWDMAQPHSTFGAMLRHYGRRMTDLFRTPDELVDVIGNRTHGALRKLFRALGRPIPGGLKGLGGIEDANWFAVSNYQAKPYPGRLVLIRCSERPGHQDELFGWQHLSSSIDVKDTPGNHMTIVKEPNVRHLGQTLRQCMKEAVANNSSEQAVSSRQS